MQYRKLGVTGESISSIGLGTWQLAGKALADGYRKRCFLATKVSTDFSAGGVKKALKNSLKALDTDWIGLPKSACSSIVAGSRYR
jgi:aryl-alcohol dehydrogenase-like predicted oxidoreductase